MRLNSDQQMKDLLAKDEQYWIGLLKKFLIDVSFDEDYAIQSDSHVAANVRYI